MKMDPIVRTEADSTESKAQDSGGAFAVISQFVVANGMTGEVQDAFRHRLHRVEQAPGFVRLEVLSPLDNPAEIWLLTWWQDAASFDAWHHSHHYHDTHRGIPKGLKLVPGRTKIRRFAHLAS